MPALKNPRWEAFAQAIVAGLASERPNKKNTAKAAYLAAGYSTTTDNATRAAASRLLTNVIPVVERIRELQEQALARVDRKLDISRERIGRNLDEASRTYDPNDLDNAQSAEQLATLLLQSVGLDPPFTAAEIESAGAANDAFVEALERIREQRLQSAFHSLGN